MNNKFQKGLADNSQREVIYHWAHTVYTALDGKIQDALANCILESDDPSLFALEFVNRPEFSELVRESIPPRSRKVSEETITAFIKVFREWFNFQLERNV